MTKKKFIHGQPVCLGIFVGSAMGGNDPDGILDLIHRAGVEIRPEGMGITWDDVFAAIKYEKEFLESNGYWYTVVNDFRGDGGVLPDDQGQGDRQVRRVG